MGREGNGDASPDAEISQTPPSDDLTFDEAIAEHEGTGLENTEPPAAL